MARLDGRFDVYSAGGLGANPKLGLKVGEAVEPEKILFYIRAMWEVFLTFAIARNSKPTNQKLRLWLTDDFRFDSAAHRPRPL